MIEDMAEPSLFRNIASMGGAIVEIFSSPSTYGVWWRVFLIGLLPTGLLAGPVFLRAYERGLPKALKIIFWTSMPALGMLIASAFFMQSWVEPGDALIFTYAFVGVGGFTVMLWLPIATAAALIGAWRRKVLLRRRQEA